MAMDKVKNHPLNTNAYNSRTSISMFSSLVCSNTSLLPLRVLAPLERAGHVIPRGPQHVLEAVAAQQTPLVWTWPLLREGAQKRHNRGPLLRSAGRVCPRRDVLMNAIAAKDAAVLMFLLAVHHPPLFHPLQYSSHTSPASRSYSAAASSIASSNAGVPGSNPSNPSNIKGTNGAKRSGTDSPLTITLRNGLRANVPSRLTRSGCISTQSIVSGN